MTRVSTQAMSTNFREAKTENYAQTLKSNQSTPTVIVRRQYVGVLAKA